MKSSEINFSKYRIVSGPYYSEGECIGGCSDNGSSACLSTGTIQPPVVSGNVFFNINDFQVNVFAEYSQDFGENWTSLTTGSINGNSSLILGFVPGGSIIRARCASTGEGVSVSDWSFNYVYPNICDIQPPVVSGNVLFNINDFQIRFFAEYSQDFGENWTPLTTGSINANSSFTLGFVPGGAVIRARCASTGEGDSVSDWSFNYVYPNSEDIQPPVVSGNVLFNINDFQIYFFAEYSQDSGANWTPLTTGSINGNSSFTLGFVPGGAVIRARCASTGEGDSVSDWSS